MRNYVKDELALIASILEESIITADKVVEWGGKDEASGEVGKLSQKLVEALDDLPVKWDKGASTFRLSGILKLDDKSMKGRKTWVYGDLPGTYEGTPFVLKMYRGSDNSISYYFESAGKNSKKAHSYHDLENLFFNFFIGVENKPLIDKLLPIKGELFKNLKEIVPEISAVKHSPGRRGVVRFYFQLPDSHAGNLNFHNISESTKKFLKDKVGYDGDVLIAYNPTPALGFSKSIRLTLKD